MAKKHHIHLANVLTPEQARKVAVIREKMQKEKPSLEEAVASGEYASPISMGDYFDIALLLADLKSARKVAGISLREYSEATGVDFGALSRLETGANTNPTVYTLARCARALNKRIQISLVDVAPSVHEKEWSLISQEPEKGIARATRINIAHATIPHLQAAVFAGVMLSGIAGS